MSPTETVGGTIVARDDTGERVGIEGVTLQVIDAEGNVVGEGTTDAEGVWLVDLPGPGVYSVELLVDTLPEGTRSATPTATS